ncbi:shikimate dehydrogenase [Mycolicibacterium fallax]|uniref:Shikimate dehydrogenase n=1 Tax=Mycolicibacterium fallax TaxID=1793 RepID=A0A1X1RH57_MYCFA|nr:shikimate dehydrogenase [Mycolicibacterium fallax]ORV06191.1 shikimate dehydrogenase [Mycolicibacterium fallax]BBY97094.1 shikimate dehydrogenase [Mycolicibacterium fallax]
MSDSSSGPRRAAVLGSPIAHSRSPLLHLAGYRALGLTDWTYERIDCDADRLPGLVGGFGPEWVGVSVTMPGKFAALAVADVRTARAELLGSANTLVRTADGWLADNTDVDGVAGALRGLVDPGSTAVVLGSGGTAPAAVAGLVALGVSAVTVAARDRDRAAPALAVAAASGLRALWCPLDDAATAPLADAIAGAAVLVSTVPADVAARFAAVAAPVPVLLDAIYDPWPTPLAAAVGAAGGTVVGGLQMLLNQAFTQVELFTGRPAPRAAMAAALDCA